MIKSALDSGGGGQDQTNFLAGVMTTLRLIQRRDSGFTSFVIEKFGDVSF